MVDIKKAKANIDSIISDTMAQHANGAALYLAMSRDTYELLKELFQGETVYNGMEIIFEDGLLDGEVMVTKCRPSCPTCDV